MLSDDELKYLNNLLSCSGDFGYVIKVGDMKEAVNCRDLLNKIKEIINERKG